jgi:hypothetical protein
MSAEATHPTDGSKAATDAENWGILHRTGPHVWTDSVLSWLAEQKAGWAPGLQPGGVRVGSRTRLLPAEAFGCAAHFFGAGARLDDVYVMHMFRWVGVEWGEEGLAWRGGVLGVGSHACVRWRARGTGIPQARAALPDVE